MREESTALATQEQVATPLAWETLLERAEVALRSGILPPSIKTREAAAVIALKGQEMGLPMMQSFEQIHVIQGRPSMATELMLALAYERVPGFVMEIVESTEKSCRVKMGRNNRFQPIEFAYSTDDAARAGLIGKDNWKKDPRGMCRWRAIGAGLKVVCPDLRRGTNTVEEMEEVVQAAITENARKTSSLDAALDDQGPAPIEAKALPAVSDGPASDAQVKEIGDLFRRVLDAVVGQKIHPEAKTPKTAAVLALHDRGCDVLEPMRAIGKGGLSARAADELLPKMRLAVARLTDTSPVQEALKAPPQAPAPEREPGSDIDADIPF
jgi:hypothetical protein